MAQSVDIDLVDAETRDLTECCVCLNEYNDVLYKPKSLPCGHTFCVKCVKVSVNYLITIVTL